MAVRKLTASSIENNVWYKSMLAGNSAYIPTALELIETTVLGSDTSSVTFTGLGSYTQYRHLHIRAMTQTTASGANLKITFNGETTGTNYGYHSLGGEGSTPFASSGYTTDGMLVASQPVRGNESNTFFALLIDLLDFQSTSKTKVISMAGGTAQASMQRLILASGIWASTSAITSITFVQADGSNLSSGTRYSLYGITG